MCDNEEAYKIYEEDSRIPCRYGVKCYQKNPVHHEKYKHPPRKDSKTNKKVRHTATVKKRKKIDTNEKKHEASDSPEKKHRKISSEESERDAEDIMSVTDDNNKKEAETEVREVSKEEEDSHAKSMEGASNKSSLISLLKDLNLSTQNETVSKSDAQTIISHLFLTEMPEDFYQFYELCQTISNEDPLMAFKDIQLKLVGPYDVFRDKFVYSEVKDKQELLKHWRYYYDPPEFQTVIKCDDKRGLHFGYWRDDPMESPVFVAKNQVNINNLIVPVAENVFGAVDACIEEKLKLVNPFEKPRITRLQQRLRLYAKENDITLEKKTPKMQQRERKVVARTFHKAGVVVPYDKKTQLGYRDLAVTDRELQKILDKTRDATSAEERKPVTSKLEEVIRLATIAADECDFGTCLELGHDLFSSGVPQVQNKALQMLSIAYAHLQRPQFLQIVETHLKDRKKGSELSVF